MINIVSSGIVKKGPELYVHLKCENGEILDVPLNVLQNLCSYIKGLKIPPEEKTCIPCQQENTFKPLKPE